MPRLAARLRGAAQVLFAAGVWLLCLGAPAEEGQMPPAGDFRQPLEYASRGGVLNVTLVAAPKSLVIDGVRLDALVFNNDYAGPVLRLRPGDRLRIRLVNHTALPINLHFHGSYASPMANGDNMHVVVAPGARFDYRLTIPLNQPPGLYWYHTHIHGLAEREVGAGLSGAMIIDGVEARVPETAGLRTRLLVLKSFAVVRAGDAAVARLHGVVQSINGAGEAEIHARAGTTEFWRISNQSPNDYYHLSIKGVRFRIVGLDGAPTNRDIDAARLDIAPAGRVEALVTFPAAGAYALMSGSTPTGVGRAMKIARELAAVKVDAAAPASLAASPTLAGVRRGVGPPDLRSAAVSTRRLIVFSEDADKNLYLINGQAFDHHRIDVLVPLGAIEEWTIRNDSDDMHVFHIHQLHFQVVAINGAPQPFDNVLDTVRVPEQGEVTIRIAFTDPQIVGRFVFHCHVLEHEDHGMMANVEVYDPKLGPDLSDGSSLEYQGRQPWWRRWFGPPPWIGRICHTPPPTAAAS